MPASNVTLTPIYVDYSVSGASTWASLGGSQAAYVAAVQQVFTDVANALYFPFGAKEFKYQVGLGAFGTSAADTTGTAIQAGAAAQSANYFNASASYATYRNKLIAITSPNSIQQIAFNITNLPVSDPISDPPYVIAGFLEEVLGLNSATTGVVAGGLGFKPASWPDTDQHGLGAGANVYGGVLHELSECMGRLINSELWWWGSPGVRQIDGTQAHYLSYDQGSTISKIYDLGLSSGGDTYDVINAQTSFAQTKPTGAVCRNATTPGFANDWLDLTVQGFILSDLGLSWAGLPNPANVSFSPGLRR